MISKPFELFSTYSIVARDPDTGQLGVAVQTHQTCVGSVVPWLLPGIGAVATQSLTNISFGPIALTMLREEVPAPQVVAGLVASDPDSHRRQLAVVDAKGGVGAWTGSGCIAEAAHQRGEGYSVQANMMTNPTVIPAMVQAYEQTSGDLAARMMAVLEAAQNEGGDIRGVQSAAMIIVPGDASKPAWARDYDLRVDEHENPVQELARLVRLHRAELLDQQGHEHLSQGRQDAALQVWSEARTMAPEMEEFPFWQAMALADTPHNAIDEAIRVLKPMLDHDPRSSHWIDLIRRLAACGLLEVKGLDDILINALADSE